MIHLGRAVRSAAFVSCAAIAAHTSPVTAYDRSGVSCTDPCVGRVDGHVVGLSSFDLRLTSDDRHVQGLDVAPNARIEGPMTEILLSMHDENSGPWPSDSHPVRMEPRASFYDLTAVGRFGRVHVERCNGECRLDVDVSSEETLVLSGFAFGYLPDDARDHHVKRFAISPGRDSAGAYLRVAMQDDDGSRPIRATIHYAAVPNRFIESTSYVDSGQRGVTGVFSAPREPGPAVLTGFSVNWIEEDHHFKRLMIDLGEERVQAAFHDNDTNRRFEHFVYYAILREPDDEEDRSGGATSICFDAVQGRIAWDSSGNRSWNTANIELLCSGNESSAEPARCFERVLHGGIARGAGTRWSWREAIELCSGSLEHRLTVGCFELRRDRGDTPGEAIDACKR